MCFGRLPLRKQRRSDKPIRELIFILNIPECESVFDEIWRKKKPHDSGLFLNIVKCFNPAHLSGRWKTPLSRSQSWFLEILTLCFVFVFFFPPHHTGATISVTCAPRGLWPSPFPLSCFSSVFTLNFGALSFKGTTRPFPLPLKNAYFLLLFTSPLLSFHAAKANKKSQFYAWELFAVWLQ